MTRDLLRHRIETKLLAAAAAAKVGGHPKVTDAQVMAQYDEGQGHALRPAGAPQGAPHPGQDEGARRPDLLAALRPRTPTSRRSPSSTRRTARRTTAATSASSTARVSSSRSPTSRSRSTEGVVSEPVKTQFGWHLIEPDGPDPARRARGRSTPRSRSRSASSSSRRRARSTSRSEFDRAVIELSRDIKFAPGYAPADRDNAVTDGATAPLALIVALGPGEPELRAARPRSRRCAVRAAPRPTSVPEALAAQRSTARGIRLESGAPTACAPDAAAYALARALPGRRDAARAAAARAPGRAGRGGRAARADGACCAASARGIARRRRPRSCRTPSRRPTRSPTPCARPASRRSCSTSSATCSSRRRSWRCCARRPRSARGTTSRSAWPPSCDSATRGCSARESAETAGRRPQPLGGRQGRERGPRGHLPRRAARAAGAARGAQGAAPRGRDRLRVRDGRRPRSAISRASSASCGPSCAAGPSPSPSASR